MRRLTKLPGRAGLLFLVSATAFTLLAGCGGSSKSSSGNGFAGVFQDVKGLSGAKREARLLDLARKEGSKLSWYTSLNSDNVKFLVTAFQKKYGIHVSLYRGHTSDVRTRLAEEAKAGRHGGDVAAVAGLGMSEISSSGLLTDYTSPAVQALIPEARQNGWVTDTLEAYVVAWNTKRVSVGQQPRSWEALADPRWKGKLAITDNDYDWYKTLHDFWVQKDGKTPAEADRLFEAIARNAVFVHGESLLSQLLASGEFDVAVTQSALIDDAAAQGAPVVWRPAVEPAMPLPLGVGLVRGARHPAAAVLIVDWLLSPEGQKLFVARRYGSVRTDQPFLPGVAKQPVDIPSLAANDKAWSDRWDRLVQLGKAGPSS